MIKKTIMLVFLLISSSFYCYSQSQIISEKELIKQISFTFSYLGVGGDDFDKLTECLLKKIKNKYPNFPKRIKNSQLKEIESLSKLYSNQCINIDGLNLSFRWTPFLENMLFSKLYDIEELKSIDSQKRKNFSECVIEGLKNQYPQGIKLVNGLLNRDPNNSPVYKCKNILLD
ncbi:hypothetical protein EOJ36_02945 [Sandaracinomonas limnophila]|uniref:Uncharacterized protein n=1 Tax=Sandaracinomonas limnophila TaxID=1862386 RepID=A0A437PXK5_9BACT|nr:hypothetical protein [Sandaracinomonas limnophila]RVU26970.1 hypothetical protein EOJ36_02945 [Sandaracinomonas limnophila]